MMTINVFYSLLLLGTISLNAQVNDSIAKYNTSDEFIEYYDDYFTTRIGFSNNFNSYTLNDKNNNLKFNLTPNQKLKSTFTFLFRFIEIDIAYTPKFIKFNNDDAENGTTKFFNIGTRLYHKKWMQNIQYSKTTGYYVAVSDLGISGDNIIFPDFKVSKMGGSTSYIFNSNYSFRAVFKQNEWQKKSAGSFVPTLSYYYTRISDNTPASNNIYDIAIAPAYCYNWVILEKILLSGGVSGGIGYNYTGVVYDDDTPSKAVDGITYQTEFKLAIGYNSPKFYSGISADINSFYHKIDSNISVKDQQTFFEFFLGYRFKVPDKYLKKFDALEQKSIKKINSNIKKQ
ncbi:DUF4421 family protein [Flavobacterium cauense]|nr:DUF4421 family protein [Flavobacterium cauense]